MKKFNEFISWIFNPLNFPITGTLLFFNYCIPAYKTDDKLSVSIIVLLTTMVIPVGYLIYKKQSNQIQDLFITERKDRKGPLIFSIVLSLISFGLIWKGFKLSYLAYLFLASALALSIALLFLKYEVKVSVHMIAVGNALGFIWQIYSNCSLCPLGLPMAFLGISILVGVARIQLKAHNIKETLIGFFSGLLVCLFVFQFLSI